MKTKRLMSIRNAMHRITGGRASRWALAALALACLPVLADEPKPAGLALTPRLQKLLSEEMLSIKQASGQILNGLVVGDHAVVATMAQQVHDSFILEKNLTEKDKKDLLRLPPEFLHLDEDFHATAQKLAEAARHKDAELEGIYFGRMVESCQTCHARFATYKFPGFAGKQEAEHAH